MGMQVLGINTVKRRLSRAARRAENLMPIWPAVGDDVSDAMAMQFRTAGAAGGRPWAPLNPDYLAWKVAHGFSPRTLIKTGDMMRSLTSRPMSIERYGPQAAEFGSRDEKLAYHHFGTRHMPQRRALFWFEPTKTRVATKVLAYIYEGKIL